MIEERVQACVERLGGLKGTGELMNTVVVMSAFSNGEFCSCWGRWKPTHPLDDASYETDGSVDVIMMYSFGRMYHRLEMPDFDAFNHDSNHEAGKLGFLMKHAIWILRIIQALPEFLLKRLSLDLESMVELKNVDSDHILLQQLLNTD